MNNNAPANAEKKLAPDMIKIVLLTFRLNSFPIRKPSMIEIRIFPRIKYKPMLKYRPKSVFASARSGQKKNKRNATVNFTEICRVKLTIDFLMVSIVTRHLLIKFYRFDMYVSMTVNIPAHMLKKTPKITTQRNTTFHLYISTPAPLPPEVDNIITTL